MFPLVDPAGSSLWFQTALHCAVLATGFLDFYIDAALSRPDAAWKDLVTMGYDRSLKRVS